jgi:hypothetical protein
MINSQGERAEGLGVNVPEREELLAPARVMRLKHSVNNVIARRKKQSASPTRLLRITPCPLP